MCSSIRVPTQLNHLVLPRTREAPSLPGFRLVADSQGVTLDDRLLLVLPAAVFVSMVGDGEWHTLLVAVVQAREATQPIPLDQGGRVRAHIALPGVDGGVDSQAEINQRDGVNLQCWPLNLARPPLPCVGSAGSDADAAVLVAASAPRPVPVCRDESSITAMAPATTQQPRPVHARASTSLFHGFVASRFPCHSVAAAHSAAVASS